MFEDAKFKNQGEPTEAALKVLAEKLGNLTGKADAKKSPNGHSDALAQQYKQVAVLDFSSERKTMSTIVSGDNNQNWVLLKGAPERVLNRCSGYITQDGNVKSFQNAKEEKEQIKKVINDYASRGLRMLAVAMAKDGGNMKHVNAQNLKTELADSDKFPELESNCHFVGYVGIRDPPRDEVKDAIHSCKLAGVNVIMITGDSKETAIAIAKELGILAPSQNSAQSCFTGQEFEELPAEK